MMSTVEAQNHKDWAIKQADAIEGYMALDELAWLYDHAYGRCVEMGSYRGRSGTVLGLKLKVIGGCLSCIDCFNDSEYDIFQDNLRKSEVSVDTLRMRSVDALEHFEDGSLDFVFIDSSHEYDDTVDEIVGWLPKLKPDGLLCGHDYGHPEFPGLTRAVHELCPGFQHPVGTIWCIDVEQFSDLQKQLLMVIQQNRQKFSEQMKQHAHEIMRLEGAVNHYDKSLVEAQLQSQELERELTSSQAYSQGLERELTSSQTYSQERERELTSSQTYSQELEKKLAILESQACIDNEKLKNLQTRVEKLRCRREKLSQELENSKVSYQDLQKVNEGLEGEIVAMQSSKFWKLRSRWFRLKGLLGIKDI